MFSFRVHDILKVFGILDNKAENVVFNCDSISMRTVKVSTMLFSEEEPVLAHKMALMENTLSKLLEGQKTLFAMVEKKGEVPSNPISSQHPNPPAPLYANVAASTSRPQVIQRNHLGQPRSKRINSIIEDEAFEETDEDSWEVSAEAKR